MKTFHSPFFDGPEDVVIDLDSNLVVSSHYNNSLVRLHSKSGELLEVIGGVVAVPRQGKNGFAQSSNHKLITCMCLVTSWEQLKQARKDRERQAAERVLGQWQLDIEKQAQERQQRENSSNINFSNTSSEAKPFDSKSGKQRGQDRKKGTSLDPGMTNAPTVKTHLAVNRGSEEHPEIDLGGPVGLMLGQGGEIYIASYMFNAILRFEIKGRSSNSTGTVISAADSTKLKSNRYRYEGIVVQDDGLLGPSGMCFTERHVNVKTKRRKRNKGGRGSKQLQVRLHVASYENHQIVEFIL